MPEFYDFLNEPSPDKLDPDAVACGNCTGYMAAKRAGGRVGVCIRDRPSPLINRFVMKAQPANPLDPRSAPVSYMEGNTDGFFTQTAWHWRCDPGPGQSGFIRRNTNGAAAELPQLPPVQQVGHADPVEGVPPTEERAAAEEPDAPAGAMRPMTPSNDTKH